MGATISSPQEIREKLAESLVMVGKIVGNDYNYAFVVNKQVAGAEHDATAPSARRSERSRP